MAVVVSWIQDWLKHFAPFQGNQIIGNENNNYSPNYEVGSKIQRKSDPYASIVSELFRCVGNVSARQLEIIQKLPCNADFHAHYEGILSSEDLRRLLIKYSQSLKGEQICYNILKKDFVKKNVKAKLLPLLNNHELILLCQNLSKKIVSGNITLIQLLNNLAQTLEKLRGVEGYSLAQKLKKATNIEFLVNDFSRYQEGLPEKLIELTPVRSEISRYEAASAGAGEENEYELTLEEKETIRSLLEQIIFVPVDRIGNATWKEIKEIVSPSVKQNDFKNQENFFKAFPFRGNILKLIPLEMALEAIAKKKMGENVRYIELMTEFSEEPVPTVFLEENRAKFEELIKSDAKDISDETLEELYQSLVNTGYLTRYVQDSKNILDNCESKVASALNLTNKKSITDPKNEITFGFNVELMRVDNSLLHSDGDHVAKFFAWAAAAFQLCKEDPHRVLGLTPVGCEGDATAMNYFDFHLRFMQFLKTKKYNANITFHALELTQSSISNEETTKRLLDILKLVTPNRFGHMTSLSHCKNLSDIIVLLRESNVSIEVCPSTIKLTVGKEAEDPLILGLMGDVPCTINTDDEGVIPEGGLTHEFFIVAERFKKLDKTPEYEILYKKYYEIVREMILIGIHNSFVEGESFYVREMLEVQTGSTTKRIPIYKFRNEFIDMHQPGFKLSVEGESFLNKSPKARIIYDCEQKFRQFEQEMILSYPAKLEASGLKIPHQLITTIRKVKTQLAHKSYLYRLE